MVRHAEHFQNFCNRGRAPTSSVTSLKLNSLHGALSTRSQGPDAFSQGVPRGLRLCRACLLDVNKLHEHTRFCLVSSFVSLRRQRWLHVSCQLLCHGASSKWTRERPFSLSGRGRHRGARGVAALSPPTHTPLGTRGQLCLRLRGWLYDRPHLLEVYCRDPKAVAPRKVCALCANANLMPSRERSRPNAQDAGLFGEHSNRPFDPAMRT